MATFPENKDFYTWSTWDFHLQFVFWRFVRQYTS